MSPQLAFPGPSEVPGFAVPLHRSLTEPILLGGAPRAIAIAVGTLAAAQQKFRSCRLAIRK